MEKFTYQQLVDEAQRRKILYAKTATQHLREELEYFDASFVDIDMEPAVKFGTVVLRGVDLDGRYHGGYFRVGMLYLMNATKEEAKCAARRSGSFIDVTFLKLITHWDAICAIHNEYIAKIK